MLHVQHLGCLNLGALILDQQLQLHPRSRLLLLLLLPCPPPPPPWSWLFSEWTTRFLSSPFVFLSRASYSFLHAPNCRFSTLSSSTDITLGGASATALAA